MEYKFQEMGGLCEPILTLLKKVGFNIFHAGKIMFGNGYAGNCA